MKDPETRRARFGVGARGSRGGGSRIAWGTIELDVEASDTIETVKAKIQAQEGIAQNRQHFVYYDIQEPFCLKQFSLKAVLAQAMLPRLPRAMNVWITRPEGGPRAPLEV